MCNVAKMLIFMKKIININKRTIIQQKKGKILLYSYNTTGNYEQSVFFDTLFSFVQIIFYYKECKCSYITKIQMNEDRINRNQYSVCGRVESNNLTHHTILLL